MGLIATVLWPGMRKLEPKSKLGGILARKRGYHNSRDHLPASDYSVAQFAVDREGPANESAAIDWTFPDAQAGNYATIAKYSKRLMAAGKADDPRTRYMREFFGNTDDDREVEGYDFAKNRPATSDSSHLWHCHLSIHRKYVNDRTAMDAVLSILSGESLGAWTKRHSRKVEWVRFEVSLPLLKQGDDDAKLDGYDRIKRIQRLAGLTGQAVDGVWGPATTAKLGYSSMTKARWQSLLGLGA